MRPEAHNKKTRKRRGKLSEAGVLGNKIKKGEKTEVGHEDIFLTVPKFLFKSLRL